MIAHQYVTTHSDQGRGGKINKLVYSLLVCCLFFPWSSRKQKCLVEADAGGGPTITEPTIITTGLDIVTMAFATTTMELVTTMELAITTTFIIIARCSDLVSSA